MMPEASSPQFDPSNGSLPPEPLHTASLQPPARSFMSRLPRLICSQNPFYLLSVCFVLHGTAHWFHRESGEAFSPWPLFGLTAGYIALLAITGFIIVRFGKVWDDARSILLLILLLFVEMSLIFDETLVRDPVTGRLLLFVGLAFSVGLSELLLRGLGIRLPWLFRLPYHLLLALLFLYPLWLVSTGPRLSVETTSWRIFLFPVAAAVVLLTMLPAVRRGPEYTRHNGTPWLWPWYPWSLFVFLAVCVSFRAYALSLSFDPVLGVSLAAAMKFESAFGAYFLVPLVLAVGVLLLEVGLVSNRRGAIRIAMLVPAVCLCLSLPVATASGPYDEFLRRLMQQVGSPVWLTLLAAAVYYGHALLRRVASAEIMLALTLLIATRVGPQTIDLATLAPPQLWPLVALAAIELMLGLMRVDSHRVFVGLTSAIAALLLGQKLSGSMALLAEATLPLLLLLAAVLLVGAIYRDDFAWLLRISGAPLIVMATLAGAVAGHRLAETLPSWCVPSFVFTMTVIAFAYAVVVRMKLYQLSGLLSGCLGSLGIAIETIVTLIRDSGWKGATSFAFGLVWFVLAVLISSWKAGWLQNSGARLRRMLTLEPDRSPVT